MSSAVSSLSSAVSVASSLASANASSSALSSAVSQASILATALSATLYAPSSTLGINTAQVASENSAFSAFESSISHLQATQTVQATDGQTGPAASNSAALMLRVPVVLRGTMGVAVVIGLLASYGARMVL